MGAGACQAFGAVLWDNWGDASPYSAIVIKDTSGSSVDWGEGADDFVLTTDTDVTGLTAQIFIGGTYTIDDWRLRIYSDGSGQPGSEILNTTVAGGQYNNPGTDQTLDIHLQTAFHVTAGVRYWVGVQAEYDVNQGNAVRWRESTSLVQGDQAQYELSSAGIWNIDSALGTGWWDVGQKNGVVADFVWKLNGEPVPEPASALVLLAGVAVVSMWRCRRTL